MEEDSSFVEQDVPNQLFEDLPPIDLEPFVSDLEETPLETLPDAPKDNYVELDYPTEPNSPIREHVVDQTCEEKIPDD